MTRRLTREECDWLDENERSFLVRIKRTRLSRWEEITWRDYDGRTADDVAEILANDYPGALSIQVYPQAG